MARGYSGGLVYWGVFALASISAGKDFCSAFASEPAPGAIQKWVLESVAEMPSGGGYELTPQPAQKLRDAFSWSRDTDGSDQLSVDPTLATPSYCTTATYMVFYKVMQKYWKLTGIKPSAQVLERLKPNVEMDGLRAWGRWNSNGPGTAKFFHDARIGKNFDRLDSARPGDFMKIFWNSEVGKNERGHSVIFLGHLLKDGVPSIKYWTSSASTRGFHEKIIPRSAAIRVLISRLTDPEAFENVAVIDENDPFLASMLIRESSWGELRAVTGLQ